MNKDIFETDEMAALLKRNLLEAVGAADYAERQALIARDDAIRAKLQLSDYLRSAKEADK